MNYKNALSMLLLLLGSNLFAQSFVLKQANEAMRELDYMTAIVLYHQVRADPAAQRDGLRRQRPHPA